MTMEEITNEHLIQTVDPKNTLPEITNKHLEDLIKSVDPKKMILPEGIITVTPSKDYKPLEKISNFMIDVQTNKKYSEQLIFGYSSGGARKHIIYYSENGTFYIIFQTVDRGTRIYFLSKSLLKEYFESPIYDMHHGNTNEKITVPDFYEIDYETYHINKKLRVV